MNHQKISKADNSSPHLQTLKKTNKKSKTKKLKYRAEAALLVLYSAI